MKILPFLRQPLVLDKDYCAVSLCRSNRFFKSWNRQSFTAMHSIRERGSQIWNLGWARKNIYLNPQNFSAVVLERRWKMDLANGSSISAASMFQILVAGTLLLWDIQDYTGCVKIGIICSKVQMLQGGGETRRGNTAEPTGAPQNLSQAPLWFFFAKWINGCRVGASLCSPSPSPSHPRRCPLIQSERRRGNKESLAFLPDQKFTSN